MPRRSGGMTLDGEDRTCPSISIVPSVGGMKPATILSVVVLPQPEGPRRDTNSPSASSRSRRSTAVKAPTVLTICLSTRRGISIPSHNEVAPQQLHADGDEGDGDHQKDAAEPLQHTEITRSKDGRVGKDCVSKLTY